MANQKHGLYKARKHRHQITKRHLTVCIKNEDLSEGVRFMTIVTSRNIWSLECDGENKVKIFILQIEWDQIGISCH